MILWHWQLKEWSSVTLCKNALGTFLLSLEWEWMLSLGIPLWEFLESPRISQSLEGLQLQLHTLRQPWLLRKMRQSWRGCSTWLCQLSSLMQTSRNSAQRSLQGPSSKNLWRKWRCVLGVLSKAVTLLPINSGWNWGWGHMGMSRMSAWPHPTSLSPWWSLEQQRNLSFASERWPGMSPPNRCSGHQSLEAVKLAFTFVAVPLKENREIFERWKGGRPET